MVCDLTVSSWSEHRNITAANHRHRRRQAKLPRPQARIRRVRPGIRRHVKRCQIENHGCHCLAPSRWRGRRISNRKPNQTDHMDEDNNHGSRNITSRSHSRPRRNATSKRKQRRRRTQPEREIVDEDTYDKDYLHCNRALYGCVKSGLLWYELFTSVLVDMGFKLNPYHPFIANATINFGDCLHPGDSLPYWMNDYDIR